MDGRAGRGLKLPSLLAVTVLSLGCPGDDEGDTGAESPSESGDASAGTAGDTGELPECDAMVDEVACGTMTGCAYYPEFGGCVLDCPLIDDEATCNMYGHCVWYGTLCDYEPLA